MPSGCVSNSALCVHKIGRVRERETDYQVLHCSHSTHISPVFLCFLYASCAQIGHVSLLPPSLRVLVLVLALVPFEPFDIRRSEERCPFAGTVEGPATAALRVGLATRNATSSAALNAGIPLARILPRVRMRARARQTRRLRSDRGFAAWVELHEMHDGLAAYSRPR